MLDTRIFEADQAGREVIGADVFVNLKQIAWLVCLNVRTKDNIADYRVTLRRDGVVTTKMLYAFDRERGALELIHDACELMRPREQGRV